MFNKPIPGLLDRNHQGGKFGVAVDRLARLLDINTNFATHFLEIASGVELDFSHGIVLSLFRSVAEINDACSVLVSQRIDRPAELLTRTQFEAVLHIKYIAETNFEMRAKCYAHQKLADELDTLRKRMKIHRGESVSDSFTKDFVSSNAKNDAANIPRIETRLAGSFYSEVHTEYRRILKKRGGRKPHWYSLFGGPKNLYDLSDQFKLGDYFDEIYGYLSAESHAQRSQTALGINSADGMGTIDGFRNGLNLPHACVLCHTFFRIAALDAADHISPELVGLFRQWDLLTASDRGWINELRFTKPQF